MVQSHQHAAAKRVPPRQPCLPTGQEGFDAGERLRHVGAAVAEAEMIAGIPELRGRQEQHALLLHEIGGKTVDLASGEPSAVTIGVDGAFQP